jgi:transcriptional regulator with XRE-family HTH domain
MSDDGSRRNTVTPEVPSLRQKWLGDKFSLLRHEAGLSLIAASKIADRSTASLSRIENGLVAVPPRDVRPLLDAYQVTDRDIRETLITVAAEVQQERKGWWVEQSDSLSPSFVDLLRLESTATSIRTFEPSLVYGLLQDEGYARYAAQSTRTWTSDQELERFIATRKARQGILRGDEPVEFHTIISEAVLHQPLGGPEVFSRQLKALLDSSERDNITVQVLPFSDKPHPGVTGAFAILSLSKLDFVHVELMTSDVYVEDEVSVAEYTAAYDVLAELAYPPERSRETIAGIMESLKR